MNIETTYRVDADIVEYCVAYPRCGVLLGRMISGLKKVEAAYCVTPETRGSILDDAESELQQCLPDCSLCHPLRSAYLPGAVYGTGEPLHLPYALLTSSCQCGLHTAVKSNALPLHVVYSGDQRGRWGLTRTAWESVSSSLYDLADCKSRRAADCRAAVKNAGAAREGLE